QVIGNHDIMIEAEFGATGVSGQVLDYQKLAGEDLQLFADKVACFIKYTGADAIAYPIGMEHAAKKNVRHEPDIERLQVVQSTLIKNIGRYIPFAQHGGSGAAKVARGLVGKNNVNTHFLVAGATAMGEYSVANIEGIRAGDKKYCGTTIFTNYVTAVAEAALFKLEEAGSKNFGKVIKNKLGMAERVLAASIGGKKAGAYDE
ncbi:MAG: class II fructose-bisphosphate aldolase, partial [Bacillota bacterium]|nr:class II fructose-bisphosphate aldolase [Bacillota bacterium]